MPPAHQAGSGAYANGDDLDDFFNADFGDGWFDFNPTEIGDPSGSLLLPPIIDRNQYHQTPNARLPTFNDAHFFDALPPLPSPSSSRHSNRSSTNEPPPSNQQASQLGRSQYNIDLSGPPGDFDEYLDFSPPPADAPRRTTTTRPSSFVDLTESSPVQTAEDMAPESRKRKRDGQAEVVPEQPGSSRRTSTKREDTAKIDLVDLSAVESDEQYKDFKLKEAARKAKEQAELIKAQNLAEASKPVKLAEFQCIICLDNPTDLTVTHCGHLFCSECLHNSLHAADAKTCPVCRSKISIKGKNGIFALEMKLMTSKKKGKQPVKAS